MCARAYVCVFIYWKLKDETLCRTVWRTRFGRSYSYAHVVRQATE